jgi:hypothetical protein
MSPSRTRKRAARPWLALVACLALSSTAFAQVATPLRVRLEAGSPLSPHATRIGIFGQTQANCAPNVERVTLDGLDLTIELHVPQSGCGAAGTASFSLHVDPAAKAGAPILPGQVYRVRVFSDAGGVSQLVAFRAIDTGGNSSNGPTPESGFWWSETTAEAGPGSRGTGISLEAQDDRIALSLFGFADTGNAAWYFGSTRLKGRVAVVPLVELDNGDPLFAPTGSQPEAQAGPRIEVEFVSPTRARAWLVRSENGRDTAVRTLSLSRSRFAPGDVGANWNGRWVLVADDESAPRQFEFAAPTRQDADTFHLVDADSGANLDCRSTVAGALPDLCTLSIGASVLADFDQIGLDHLDGRGKLGAAAKLVRVPR